MSETHKALKAVESDQPKSTENASSYVDLYHPKGPRVRLAITQQPLNYALMLQNVGAMLDAGWLPNAPGLDDGEERERVGWVLRGAFEKEGEVTPFVLLYADNEQLTWSILKVYLNTAQDREAFEYASKMKLEHIPDYVGNDKPQRGASQKTDKFIVRAPKPFGVVFRKNPKHDPNTEEGKMKPARLFVRWEDQRPQANVADREALRQKSIVVLRKSAEQGHEAFETAWKLLQPPAREACEKDREGIEALSYCIDLQAAANKGEKEMADVWNKIPRELKTLCQADKDSLKAMLANRKPVGAH